MRKAQVTIFIILAIIIAGIFFFLFRFSQSVTEEQIEGKAAVVYRKFLEKTTLEEYITSCLDNNAKEALILVGLQGGNIYDYQIPDTTSLSGTPGKDYLPFDFNAYNKQYSLNLQYSLKKPQDFSNRQPCTYHCGPPTYPYPGQLVDEHLLQDRNLVIQNAFGLTFLNDGIIEPRPTLVPLCDPFGANWYKLPGATLSCEIFNLRESQTSIQNFLEKYIKNKTNECINFSHFSEKNYDIVYSDLKSDVLIGENDVIFALNYSINVSLAGNAPITRSSIFSSRQNIKLKKMYELAHHMILEDVKNIFFDMTDSSDLTTYLSNSCSGFDQGTRVSKQLPCFNPGSINVSVVRDVCPTCSEGTYSDVIQIKDNSSFINGKPYIFQFAVQNRMPALNFIPDMTIAGGDPAEIIPNGIDPDGDRISYFIEDSAGSHCCKATWNDPKFTFTGLSGNNRFNIYACDDEGISDCTVSVTNCGGSARLCGSPSCRSCDYQTVNIDVT